MAEHAAAAPVPAWRRVLGEIAIIVLGVLIALAVNDWAQGRNDRALERRYLERLRADAGHNAATLEQMLHTNESRAATLAAYDAWVAGAGARPDEAAVADAMCRWFIAYSPDLQHTTYAELVGSGNFAVLRDERLRILLGQAAASYERAQRVSPYGDVMRDATGPLERHRTWQLDPALERGSTCRFDHDALRTDPDTRSMLAQLYREQVMHRNWRTNALDATRAVLARLDELQATP